MRGNESKFLSNTALIEEQLGGNQGFLGRKFIIITLLLFYEVGSCEIVMKKFKEYYSLQCQAFAPYSFQPFVYKCQSLST